MRDGDGVLRRFGPLGVWLGVMLADLAVSGWWLAMFVDDVGDGGDPTVISPPLSTDLGIPGALALSLAGSWWAVLGRSHHPQTVRGGIAVSVLRLVLLGAFMAMLKAMDTE